MLDPLIVKTISIGLGLMFLLAGYHKLVEAVQFRVTLLEYQVLPEALVSPASRIVPFVELMLGGAWLFGWYQDGMTAITSAALLGLYASAISINLFRGRVHFDCGCGFGGQSDNEQYLSGGLVVRNHRHHAALPARHGQDTLPDWHARARLPRVVPRLCASGELQRARHGPVGGEPQRARAVLHPPSAPASRATGSTS